MQWLKNISRSDWLLIGLYYVVVLPLIIIPDIFLQGFPFFSMDALYIVGERLADYAIDLIVVLIIVYVIFNRFFHQGKYVLTFILSLGLLGLQRLLQPVLLPIRYDYLEAPYLVNLIDGITTNAEAISALCLFLIAKQFYESKSQIMELQKEKKESELRWLKAQIDPHFLFNNLNILDILINTDPKKASTYTKRLSSLYRYMIRHKDEDVVSLAEEWKFSQDYIYLLQQRFEELFIFNDDLAVAKLRNYYIPPATMQTLLENIVKHNVALPDEPITTEIYLEDDCLLIKNELRKKLNVKDSTGTGLDNLRRRIKILTDQEVQVDQASGYFTVKVPLVKQID